MNSETRPEHDHEFIIHECVPTFYQQVTTAVLQ